MDRVTHVDRERLLEPCSGERYEPPEELGLRKTLAVLAVLALLIGAVLLGSSNGATAQPVDDRSSSDIECARGPIRI